MIIIFVIVGTTRPGRFSEEARALDPAARKKRDGVDARLLGLRDFPCRSSISRRRRPPPGLRGEVVQMDRRDHAVGRLRGRLPVQLEPRRCSRTRSTGSIRVEQGLAS
jgi:hypothetical protein